jgi:NAD(P)-dependent dehydrogenase (short-subunit alcohol dehydrogenase family)
VTGGSGGISGAISKRLMAEGAMVHVLDMKPPEGENQASFYQLDVSNESAVDQVLDAVGAKAGRVDYLVCCAGI